MKKFIEKLIGRLKERENHYRDEAKKVNKFPKIRICRELQMRSYSTAIKIVNKLAEEYKQEPYASVETVRTNRIDCEVPSDYFEQIKEVRVIDEWSEEYKVFKEELQCNGWIPCSERLPSVGVTVLCYWRKSGLCDNTTSYYYTFMHRNEDNIWISDFGICTGAVLAWQPLPEPYKEGELV